jgi:hypothetical protein
MLVPPSYLQQEIVEASNEAARKYYDKTLEEEGSGLGVIAVMTEAAKSKHQSFKGQFSKYIANPKLGDQFLEEVTISYLHPCQIILKHNWTMLNFLSSSYKSQNIGATIKSLR